jgi:DNA-3-methyladenine glycosylase I
MPNATQTEARKRCGWCGTDPLYVRYHDEEWGVPAHDDRVLFEFLILEGAQAGLSWLTVLRKREHYRQAFAGFDPQRVARFDGRKVETLLQNPGIIRNRAKIQAAIGNARAFLAVQKQFGSFDAFQWAFVGGKPIVNRRRSLRQLPPRTPRSDALGRALRERGFRFVGSTIVYAHMQAVGMVNDHLITCFRHAELTPADH